MPALVGTLNLAHLDLEHVTTHERAGRTLDPLVSIVQFGEWETVLTITATDPAQLERLGEVCLEAARDLRIANGEKPTPDELDVWAS